MNKPVDNKIIVSVNFSQKEKVNIDGTDFLLAKQFNNNRRESMPVLCTVEDGNDICPRGTMLLVHHNRFVANSPHHIQDNLYSLAWNESIFARLDKNGDAIGICGNIVVEYVFDKDNPLLTEQQKVPNKHKYKVLQSSYGFKKDRYIFAYPFANYEIVYVWNGIEKRVLKIFKNDIVAKLIN